MNRIIAAFMAILGMSEHATEEAPANESVIDDMRSMALNIKAAELGINKESFPNEVFGVLMETGFEGGSFTLLFLAEGTTSLYFSNGGGIIGAGTHETVRKASSVLLSGANHFRPQTNAASDYPYPNKGEVNFYLVGFNGVTSYTAKEQDLGENKDLLSPLFHASHAVITELRQVEESRHNKASNPTP